jgi:hypothetical protein
MLGFVSVCARDRYYSLAIVHAFILIIVSTFPYLAVCVVFFLKVLP